MADDTNEQGTADRSRVAAGEGYEVAYFAGKHGITQKAARELIAEIGNDREKLDAAATARAAAKPVREPAESSARKASARSRAAPAASRKQAAASSSAKKGATPVVPAVRTAAKPARRKAGRGGIASAVAPVTESIGPVAKSIADRARTAASAMRRSSASARQRIAATPATVSKRASKALDATRTAATGRTAALVSAAAAGLVTGLVVNLARKSMVQAPSVMAGDWFEALKAEHALALAIFDAIEATTAAEPAKRTVLLTQLKHALGKHAFTEENVIYPALRDWGDKADADKLNHDHGYVKQALYELDALDKASPAYLSRLAAFRADLEAHIREEEEAVFPPLHASLDDARNAHITALANREGFKLA